MKLTSKQEEANALLGGNATLKRCTKCERVLNAGCFHRSAKEGLKSRCKDCMKAANAARYISNKDHIQAVNAKWLDANREQRAKTAAQWMKANREKAAEATRKWRDANAELARKQVAEYAKKNKPANNERCARRRASCQQAQPQWADKRKMRELYAEAARLSRYAETVYHVDHIIPLNSDLVCGLHAQTNLCILEGKQNSSKGNRYWPDMP